MQEITRRPARILTVKYIIISMICLSKIAHIGSATNGKI